MVLTMTKSKIPKSMAESTNTGIAPHPEARNLIRYLLDRNDFQIIAVHPSTWMAKFHTLAHGKNRHEYSRMLLHENGAYEIGQCGFNGFYTRNVKTGHVNEISHERVSFNRGSHKLARYLLNEDDFGIAFINTLDWKAKIHFLVEFDGTKSFLTINNNGDFEFAREGPGKLYDQEMQTGTIDITPVGQAGIARAEQIGTTLTGHDMKAIQWLNFQETDSGRHLVPVNHEIDRSYLLVETDDGRFSVFQGDNPRYQLPCFQKHAFAEGVLADMNCQDLDLKTGLSISDRKQDHSVLQSGQSDIETPNFSNS